MATADGVQWADFRIPPINLWVMPHLGTSRDKPAGVHDLVAGLCAERRRTAGRGRDAEAQTNNTHEMNQTRQLHRQLLAIRGGNHGNQN